MSVAAFNTLYLIFSKANDADCVKICNFTPRLARVARLNIKANIIA